MSTREMIDLSGLGWRMWRDAEAVWEHDTLYLPPVEVHGLPQRPPSAGWEALPGAGQPVKVPGTVEEYTWDEVGDYRGVSWWSRTFTLPELTPGARVTLQFESVRLRAEVFLDRELVGYDVVGNTPFEVDLSGKVVAGQTHELAVRITDPGGNFTWEDHIADRWGDYTLPASHGFGGITGPVRLCISDRVCVGDIFVKNKPTPTDVDIEVAILNAGPEPAQREARIEIVDALHPTWVVFDRTIGGIEVEPGQTTTASCSASVPEARLWSPEEPNLYRCRVTLSSGDTFEQTFGFRWFGVEGVGKHALFRLNGKRIVLRSAISWGFWPENGIFPSRELATKQVHIAKAMGLNMINFHRAIGQPPAMDAADEFGLLSYEEPGGYTAGGGDEFCRAWAREKLLRMVRRDRNHPSLVIYNMINEETADPAEHHKLDMRAVHQLDPTRCITFSSSWHRDGHDPKKLHMLPYDDRQRVVGWADHHHATGPGVYRDEFYQGPTEYRLRTTNAAEIVFWGEEGATGTPPRLELIHQALQIGRNGWDGADYEKWYQAYVDYLDRKQLRKYFPTVDELTRTIGDIAFYYHGRIIESIRIGNTTNAYVINGWEAEKIENHSGVVDCYRNPKGNPQTLAYYNQPLYIAVKLRTRIEHAPANVVADLYIVNEVDLRGPHTLTVFLADYTGCQHWLQDYPVNISGGETFGELLVSGIEITADVPEGWYFVRAELRGIDGKVRAQGRDDLLLVDWRRMSLSENGALLDDGHELHRFLDKRTSEPLPEYDDLLAPLDYILVGDFDPMPRQAIPDECFLTSDGRDTGLTGEYFHGTDFAESFLTRLDTDLHIEPGKKGAGGIFVPGLPSDKKDLSIRWTGQLIAPENGVYMLHAESDDGIRLWISDQLVIDEWTDFAWWHGRRQLLVHGRPIQLEAGKKYDLRIEHFQSGGEGSLRLFWTPPSMRDGAEAVARSVARRVRDDGTTAVILDHTYAWAQLLGQLGVLKYRGWMHGKRNWLGSNFFVRQHPLFANLPVNQGMNWHYQEFAEYDAKRYGLLLEDEEAAVGFVTDHQHKVGTAVGVVQFGKGRFVLSTLEILPRLNEDRPPCEVVRKLLCNYIDYAAQKSQSRSDD